MTRQDIIAHRKNKFLNIGREKGLSNGFLSSEKLFSNSVKNFAAIKNKIIVNKINIYILIFIIFVTSLYFLT